MGASRIDLNVFGDNATAINLYQSLGYQVSSHGHAQADMSGDDPEARRS